MKLKDNYKHLCDTGSSRRYIDNNLDRDMLCLSVADSDFQFSEYITKDLIKFLKEGDLNYAYKQKSFTTAVNHWYKKEYNNSNLHKDFKEEEIVIGNGVINFIQLSIEAFSNEGDGVIFLSPVYYAFLTSVENANRVPKKCLLLFDKEKNEFEIDFCKLEKLMKEKNNKIFVFCSPHNPISRVWRKNEIEKIIKIARENDVLIVSDEIWQDIIFEDRTFNPLVYFSKNTDKILSISSFGKTYNLGGAQFGYALSYNQEIIKTLVKTKNKHLIFASDNLINIEIFKSCAYNHHNYLWLIEYKEYLYQNYLIFKEMLKDTKIIMPDMQGTYLCWLDFSQYKNISAEKLDQIFNDNKIHLESGSDFCEEYDLCKRINLSISRKHIIRVATTIQKYFNLDASKLV